MRQQTIRRWLLAAVFSAAGIGGALAYESATHADTPPAIHGLAAEHLPADGDTIGQLITSLTTDTDSPRATPAPGCPGSDRTGCPTGSVTSFSAAAGTLMPADITTSAVTAPPLDRLEHARARSSIPGSPVARLDPRPA